MQVAGCRLQIAESGERKVEVGKVGGNNWIIYFFGAEFNSQVPGTQRPPEQIPGREEGGGRRGEREERREQGGWRRRKVASS